MTKESLKEQERIDHLAAGEFTQEEASMEEHPLEETEEEIIELMGFRLGSEEYAIDIMKIKEITPFYELTSIPRAPAYILGVLSLRGNIIPIFDAKKKIGLPETEITEKTRIIVLDNGDEQVGIKVDSISSAVQIPTNTLEPPPPVLKGVEADFITGIGRYQDRMIIIMNTDEVIQMNE
jgi:purine-binding chemotaxis protein CheW